MNLKSHTLKKILDPREAEAILESREQRLAILEKELEEGMYSASEEWEVMGRLEAIWINYATDFEKVDVYNRIVAMEKLEKFNAKIGKMIAELREYYEETIAKLDNLRKKGDLQ